VEVIAVDLPREDIWQRLVATAESGASLVHFPVRASGGHDAGSPRDAGANLIEDVPELTAWLRHFADQPVVLGFYVYADGPLHVQATVAGDALADSLRAGNGDVTVAYAGTPSECYLVPLDVVEDSNLRRRRRPRRAMELALRGASAHRLYRPAYERLLRSSDGEQMGIADAVVTQQGPNYALAKRLQRWRSIAAWQAGAPASFNVAPPTWTVSVTKNRLLAAGYYGARYAGLEVFSPDTMRTLMTALLVHDLHVPPRHEHPELTITRNGVHGGYWRVPHDIRSTLLYTAAVGLPRAFMPRVRFR
jgi:hypothetical protein